jgi:large subunit ribosomal protein L25
VSQHVLEVSSREATGKEAAKRLRREGFVPAVAYGHQEEPVKLTVHAKTLRDIISHEGSHGLFNLKQEGAADLPVIIKSLQKHPVSHAVIAVDFLRVSMTEKVRSTVTIHLTGESAGVKVEGGVLVQALHEIEVEAFPQDIPEHINVDISGLEFNGAPIHVSEISLPNNVIAITDGATPVAVVNPPTVEPIVEAPDFDANAVPATEVSAEAVAAELESAG